MHPRTQRSVKDLTSLPAHQAQKVKLAAMNPVQAPAEAPAVHAGVERWPVKTGTDADVGKVGNNDLEVNGHSERREA